MFEPMAWHWWVIGLVLMMIEVIFPTTFFVWIGAAAIATGLVSWLLPVPAAMQLVLCAAFSLVAVWLGQRYFGKPEDASDEDTELNTGAHRLIGRHVVVTTAISNGLGRVRVGDGEWRATGPDLPAGSPVTIVGVEGSTVQVVPRA